MVLKPDPFKTHIGQKMFLLTQLIIQKYVICEGKRAKQCGPRSYCYRSSLIWVYTVKYTSKTFQQTIKHTFFVVLVLQGLNTLYSGDKNSTRQLIITSEI